MKGIHFVYGEDGRVNGDCFVELASQEDVKIALEKHRKNIGRRYVEGLYHRVAGCVGGVVSSYEPWIT